MLDTSLLHADATHAYLASVSPTGQRQAILCRREAGWWTHDSGTEPGRSVRVTDGETLYPTDAAAMAAAAKRWRKTHGG